MRSLSGSKNRRKKIERTPRLDAYYVGQTAAFVRLSGCLVLVAVAASAAVAIEAATTTPTTEATAAPSAETAAPSATLSGSGFIDGELTTVNFAPVESSDGRIGCLARIHLDKGESARTACVPISHDIG